MKRALLWILSVVLLFTLASPATTEQSCVNGAERCNRPLGQTGLQVSRGVSSGGCPNCMAVVLIPDTQFYVTDENPKGAAHLSLIMRYVCANRSAWTEPSTGKTMPIGVVLGIGDIVNDSGDASEWTAADAAYDILDNCSTGVVPYMALVGNHDLNGGNYHQLPAAGWDTNFNQDRYSSYQCADETACLTDAGEWFIGDDQVDIVTNGRNNDNSPGPTCSGSLCNGRHRVVLIRGPSGHRWLFLGTDIAFDYGHASTHANNVDHAQYLRDVLDDYSNVYTVVLSHALVDNSGVPAETNTFACDDCNLDSFGGAGQAIFQELIDPYDQVFLAFGGHFSGNTEVTGAGHPNTNGLAVLPVMRNYQNQDLKTITSFTDQGGSPNLVRVLTSATHGYEATEIIEITGATNFDGTYDVRVDVDADEFDIEHAAAATSAGTVSSGYGDGAVALQEDGWTPIMVFDVDADEVRIRSYRIEDTDADNTHDGTPADTADLTAGWNSAAEIIIQFDFTDAPASTDNCTNVYNPDQRTSC